MNVLKRLIFYSGEASETAAALKIEISCVERETLSCWRENSLLIHLKVFFSVFAIIVGLRDLWLEWRCYYHFIFKLDQLYDVFLSVWGRKHEEPGVKNHPWLIPACFRALLPRLALSPGQAVQAQPPGETLRLSHFGQAFSCSQDSQVSQPSGDAYNQTFIYIYSSVMMNRSVRCDSEITRMLYNAQV